MRYYSESGKLQSENKNIIATFEYDSNGNLIRENYRANASSHHTTEYDYEFDKNGNLIKKTTYKDGKLESWTEYKYQKLERFGTKNVQYTKVDDKYFTVTTFVEVSDQFFGWLLGFGRRVKLIGNPETVEKFTAYLDKIRDMY